MAAWGVEAKLQSFVTFAIAKLDSAEAELTDEDEEDNYQELVVFVTGLSRNLKNVGAAGSPELKGAIMQALLNVWDIRTDKPGPDLRGGGVPGVRKALQGLLEGPLKGATAPEAEAAPEVAMPGNIQSMSLQDAVSYMWNELDKPNRVEWGDDGFVLDLQKKGRFGQDTCRDPLFCWVNKDHKFWQAKTTKTFIALLDNYEREVGKGERITAEEKREMSDFLDALGATPVMQFCFEFLKMHGKDPRCKKLRSMADFQNLLFDLWLAPYRRVKKDDSSGFEHVFVGEESRGKITGLHNWVQYYIEEQKGNIDYQGWAGKQDSDYDDDVNIVTVKFAWQDDDPDVEVKPMSTILCGSTVEFEMAILSMVFLAGNQEGDTPLKLGNEKIKVTCYPQKQRYGGPKIATAFMEVA